MHNNLWLSSSHNHNSNHNSSSHRCLNNKESLYLNRECLHSSNADHLPNREHLYRDYPLNRDYLKILQSDQDGQDLPDQGKAGLDFQETEGNQPNQVL